MILRNGIRSNLRAKGRSALFAALIFALTVTLTLGLGMWAYCARMLAQCDETYTSIALLEYMGVDYPDADAADAFARSAAGALDDGAIAAVEGVERWERTDRTLVKLEGYSRAQAAQAGAEKGVIVVDFILSSPVYDTRLAPVPEEALPDTYVTYDINTGVNTIYHGDDAPVDLSNYYYDAAQGVYLEIVSDGSIQQIQVPEEALAEPYICRDWGSGALMEIRYDGPVDLDDPELPVYQRDNGVCFTEEQAVAGYRATIRQTLYARDAQEGTFAYIELGDSGLVPESGKHYLIHAAAFDSDKSNQAFSIVDFYEGCETPPYLAVADGDGALTDSLFTEYAGLYWLRDNFARLTASADPATLEEFQQGYLYLDEGRFPEPGEAGACVLSGATAAWMGAKLGDTVNLSLLDSDPEDRFRLADSGSARTLTVVGITNANRAYEGCLWVSDAEGGFDGALYGYQLGRAVLDNAGARSAVEALEALMPGQVRVTLFDQGYAAAAQPLETMRATALTITLASAAGALAVLVLFAYLFVGRQRETVDILLSLGTPKRKVTLWLLSGAAVIAGASALLGGLLGGGLLGRVLRAALSSAQSLYEADQRYSESLVGLQRSLAYDAAPPRWPALAAALGVFLAGLLLCALFLRQARRRNAPTRGKRKARIPRGGTATGGRGALRFALRNARRGGLRSCVVPAAALVLALFIGLLASAAQGWERQLDQLYENSKIEGQVVSLNGRTYSGLAVAAPTARQIWNSGRLSALDVSIGWHYWLAEEMPAFSDGGFGAESRSAWIGQQPSIYALSSLSAAPEFYYTQPQVEWLEGWDESVLASGDYGAFYEILSFGLGESGGEAEVYPVVASRSFLEAHELELGDEFVVCLRYALPIGGGNDTWDMGVSLKAVGSFVQQGPKANLYVPLAFYFPPQWLTGAEDVLTNAERHAYFENRDDFLDNVKSLTSFGTCRFTLSSAYALEALRDDLAEQGFSQVGSTGHNRTAILLRDAAFTETVGSLGRYITFGSILFPILLAVVGVLGFIISWLMINGRRMEFAILRGLGASRGKVFLTFFLEQALLCLGGCGAACLILAFVPSAGPGRWLAVGGFCLCYLAGCALSVLAVGRTNLMSLLSERE